MKLIKGTYSLETGEYIGEETVVLYENDSVNLENIEKVLEKLPSTEVLDGEIIGIKWVPIPVYTKEVIINNILALCEVTTASIYDLVVIEDAAKVLKGELKMCDSISISVLEHSDLVKVENSAKVLDITPNYHFQDSIRRIDNNFDLPVFF